MTRRLEGKRAIVTAGAAGIGRVIAKTLRSEGAEVAVCDIDAAALDTFSATSPGLLALPCDVADPAQVSETLKAMLAYLGGIDILVNNAGSAGPTAAIEDISPADWLRTIDVNLNSQFLFTRGVVPHMKAQGSGSIVNMSSAAGRLGMPMRTPYAAAKWAVVGLTQSLAMELGSHNIRVNAILPGSVKGPRMDRVIQARAAATGKSITEVEAEELAVISMRRMIDPQEIADLVAFICSDSGRSISGQSLGVCGNTEVLR